MKSIFLESFKEFKKKFYLFLIIDVAYLVLLLIFLIFSKNTLYGLSSIIQNNALALQNIDTSNVDDVVQVLNDLKPMMNKALFFIYFLIPLGIFLLFLFSRYFIFNLFKKKKLVDYFFIILPFFSLYLFSLIKFLLIFDIFYGNFNSYSLLLFFLLLLISSYFLILGLSLYGNYKEVYKHLFVKLKKFYLYFPIFLLYALISFFVILFLILMHFSLLAGFYKISVMFFILFILFLLILSWYRIFFVLYVNN